MKIIILILLLQIACFSQEIISTEYPSCYSYKNIKIPADDKLVESALGIKLNVRKNIAILMTKNETYYFYDKILFRLEIRNKKLNCNFNKFGYYKEGDVIVYYNKDNKTTNILSLSIWEEFKKKL